jgi:hypothetical protein
MLVADAIEEQQPTVGGAHESRKAVMPFRSDGGSRDRAEFQDRFRGRYDGAQRCEEDESEQAEAHDFNSRV